METRSDRILGTIRTYVPAAVGAFIAWLIGKIPAVADVLNSINTEIERAGLIGFTATGLIQSLVLAGVIALYYWLSRVAAKRHPALERWLLGSSKSPVYFKAEDADTVKAGVPVPERRDAVQTAGDSVIVEDRDPLS